MDNAAACQKSVSYGFMCGYGEGDNLICYKRMVHVFGSFEMFGLTFEVVPGAEAGYSVQEKQTGMDVLMSSCSTPSRAIRAAHQELKSRGKEAVLARVKDKLDEFGAVEALPWLIDTPLNGDYGPKVEFVPYHLCCLWGIG